MPEVTASKYLVQAGWDDCAHLDEATKAEMLAETPAYLRDARSKGTPSLGAGAIYPIEQSEIMVDPFPIPAYWAKGYGFDPGWKRTAAIFGAWDRDADILYLYTEHYRGQAEPSVHADAIKARGDWLTGASDPAGADVDGQRVLDQYRGLGLNLIKADKSVEGGILAVWQRLASGRLKVFSSCQNWFAEHRLYRRDENGKIIKDFDHLMDATRYLVMKLPDVMRTKPVPPVGRDDFRIADQYAGY